MIETLILHGIIYALIGMFAGLMAGMFGIGGGLVVIPGLLFVFQKTQIIPAGIQMYVAIATSLAVMIITATASFLTHKKMGSILWSVFNKLWPGLIAGTIAGSIAAAWIPTDLLKIFFAVFLLCMAVKMLRDRNVSYPEHQPKQWVNYLINTLIGVNAGLLGVGGGILMVPYLNYCGIEVRKIAAITNLCALTVALIGTLSFMITGYRATALIPGTIGYVYWPAVVLTGIFSSLMAPIGAHLNYKLPVHQLRFGFVAILILTAIKMLF